MRRVGIPSSYNGRRVLPRERGITRYAYYVNEIKYDVVALRKPARDLAVTRKVCLTYPPSPVSYIPGQKCFAEKTDVVIEGRGKKNENKNGRSGGEKIYNVRPRALRVRILIDHLATIFLVRNAPTKRTRCCTYIAAPSILSAADRQRNNSEADTRTRNKKRVSTSPLAVK